jgi:hypothetical protein
MSVKSMQYQTDIHLPAILSDVDTVYAQNSVSYVSSSFRVIDSGGV